MKLGKSSEGWWTAGQIAFQGLADINEEAHEAKLGIVSRQRTR